MTDKDDNSISFQWSSDDVNMSTGFTAQEVGSIDLGSISITGNGASPSYYIDTSVDTISIGSAGNYNSAYGNMTFGNEVNAAYIQTSKHRIDLDELAEVFETVKKRLLILAPNFEMHEKYPMLKELYDEYKAMERLLSGPDKSIDE